MMSKVQMLALPRIGFERMAAQAPALAAGEGARMDGVICAACLFVSVCIVSTNAIRLLS